LDQEEVRTERRRVSLAVRRVASVFDRGRAAIQSPPGLKGNSVEVPKCQVGCDHPVHDDPCAYLAKHDPSRDPNCPCDGQIFADMRAGKVPIQ
jgi:hypothetical protein